MRELDVLDARLEKRGRRELAALDHLVEHGKDRGAARHERARAARAAATRKLVAVALVEADALEGHAELVDDDLGEGRLMALAMVMRAAEERHVAILLEADAAELGSHGGRHLEIGRDASPAQLAALAAQALAGRETLPIRGVERLIHQALEIAAIIGLARGGGVGEILRPDEIAPTQGDPIDADLGGRKIDQPLHEIHGLGPPRAAIGAHRNGVGEHAFRRDFDELQCGRGQRRS